MKRKYDHGSIYRYPYTTRSHLSQPKWDNNWQESRSREYKSKRKKRFRIPNFDRKNETSGHDINLNQMKFSESLNSADLKAFSKIGSWTPYIFGGFFPLRPQQLTVRASPTIKNGTSTKDQDIWQEISRIERSLNYGNCYETKNLKDPTIRSLNPRNHVTAQFCSISGISEISEMLS